jgi:hypothetical protein
MYNKTNLALVEKNPYNDVEKEIYISKIKLARSTSNNFMVQVKRAMIYRENLISAGMEVGDIIKACDLYMSVRR